MILMPCIERFVAFQKRKQIKITAFTSLRRFFERCARPQVIRISELSSEISTHSLFVVRAIANNVNHTLKSRFEPIRLNITNDIALEINGDTRA